MAEKKSSWKDKIMVIISWILCVTLCICSVMALRNPNLRDWFVISLLIDIISSLNPF